MRPVRIIFTALIMTSFGLHAAVAAEGVAEIAEAWGRAYRNLPERAEYHYQCSFRATATEPEVDLGIGFDPTNAAFSLEIYRLGKCVRWHAISRPDFADMATLGWIQGFDGQMAYVVQCEARSYSVYSARFNIDELISRGQPFVDPLAGALGLSPAVATGMVKKSPRAFGVEAALKSGTYRLTADDRRTVTLVADGMDELVLSREHDYAVERRTWYWDGDQLIKCVIANSDWKQFRDGKWYPALSKFSYFGNPKASPDNPCLKVTLRFAAMSPSTADDFEVIADRPGWSIELFSPENEFQTMTIQRGEEIRLSQVARGDLRLRVAVSPADVEVVRFWVRRELIAVIVIVITLVTAMDIIGHRYKPRAGS